MALLVLYLHREVAVLRSMAICFGLMQVSACFSVLAAALYDRLGAVPVSVAISVFSGAFLGVVLGAIKWKLEKSVS